MEHRAALVSALGKIEEIRHDIRVLDHAVAAAPAWRPSHGLRKQCAYSLGLIDALEARLERKLVVTIIGPCGSGKSTLLNALAGADELSATGIDRPTTDRLVVLCSRRSDADFITSRLESGQVTIAAGGTAAERSHLILVDTPDTDSVARSAHIPVVQAAVSLSDILICVFNAENPKTRDHVDFFAPIVQRFDGDSLVGVLNRCDRLDEAELKERILPDFSRYLSAAWTQPVERVFCVSARNNLKRPDWSPGAEPRHHFDQFDALRQLVYGAFKSNGFVIDRRIDNARRIRDDLGLSTLSAVEAARTGLAAAQEAIRQAEGRGLTAAAAALGTGGPGPASRVNSRLYEKLAGRWMGPVGWLIAAWARLVALGSGMASLFRHGYSFRRARKTDRIPKRFGEAPMEPEVSVDLAHAENALIHYRLAVRELWPDIARQLVDCRFDESVSDADTALPPEDDLRREIADAWHRSMEAALEAAGRKLSAWPLQLIFNLPVVGILVHAGWNIVASYIAGNYLPANYFIHTGVMVAIVLVLSFFLFQMCARLAGGADRIRRSALESAGQRIAGLQPLTRSDAARQVAAVLSITVLK